MRLTESHLRQIIREELSQLNEYETYTDEHGNVWDDEGNVTRSKHGSAGVRHGKPHASRYQRPAYERIATSPGALDVRDEMVRILSKVTAEKPNKFLDSIISQLNRARTLTQKQKDAVINILKRSISDPHERKIAILTFGGIGSQLD